MKTIYDLLKSDVGSNRLSCGNRWLVMDQMYDENWEYVVYGQERRAKVQELYRGNDEEDAVTILTEEDI